eukprot:CAMPEP_0172314450 /NCGR_PEP_ID=MMETSP1058-20130122/22560_1 /TAXON_ID=83371 /ORGANISM="Detonula confervacea, Strain CCMP 353" /LENGTH=183 /DNA_ID=CAMNT_0013028321 /DNA_START=115 /DNA_END=663 /DNA_ORIENTATION=-
MILAFTSVLVFIALSICSTTEAFTNNCHLTSNQQRRLNTQLDVEPAVIAGAVATAGAVTWWLSGADGREKQAKYAEWETKEREYQEERERLAYIEPRDVWREEDLKSYNGSDETGPLLMAVKGDVYNVWKGRSFYGPGAEYNIMAGRDATRFLAKNRLEEETDEEKEVKLNVGERANLMAWYW